MYRNVPPPKDEREILKEKITCSDFNRIEKEQAEKADSLNKLKKHLSKKESELDKETDTLKERETKLRKREEVVRKNELKSESLDKEIKKREQKLEDLEGKLKEIEIEIKAKELLNSKISIIDSESASRFKNTMTLSNQVLKEIRQVKLQNEEYHEQTKKEYNDCTEFIVDSMEDLKSQPPVPEIEVSPNKNVAPKIAPKKKKGLRIEKNTRYNTGGYIVVGYINKERIRKAFNGDNAFLEAEKYRDLLIEKDKSRIANANLNNHKQLELGVETTTQTEEEKYRSKLLDNYSFQQGKSTYYLSFANMSIEQYENEMLDLYECEEDVGETRIWVQKVLLSEPTSSDPFGNSLDDPCECLLKKFPEVQEDFKKAFGIP